MLCLKNECGADDFCNDTVEPKNKCEAVGNKWMCVCALGYTSVNTEHCKACAFGYVKP